jgi:hypothetical protein
MKGGLLIKPNYTEETAFKYFISNSKISVFNSGSSGIILKCVINNEQKSPYQMIRTGVNGKNVNTILIKLCIIKGINNNNYNFVFDLKDEHRNIVDTNIKNISYEIDFTEEVRIQKEIFEKTKKYNNPICPSIIYSKHLKTKDKNDIDILNSIINKLNEYNKMIIHKNVLDLYLTDNNITIGLIGMEIAEGYKPLCIVIDELKYKKQNAKNKELKDKLNNAKEIYECMAKLKFIEMAVKTGYSHNDFHDCNFLINTHDIVSFKIPGNIMIIDFGDSRKINNNILEKIDSLYLNNHFTEVLNEMYNIDDVRDFLKIDLQQYKWLITKNIFTNTYIKKLNQQQLLSERLFKQNGVIGGEGRKNKTLKNSHKKSHKKSHKNRRNKTSKMRDLQ